MPPPSWSLSTVSDEKLADNYCPYTKILIKVQMWCGHQKPLLLWNQHFGEHSLKCWRRRHESSLAPNLQLHKLPLQAIWWRLAVNGGASIAVTVKRSTEGRGESSCCHSSRSTVRKVWDDIGDISQASNSSSSPGNKWRKKLCVAPQRIFTLNVGGKFMLKGSFLIQK